MYATVGAGGERNRGGLSGAIKLAKRLGVKPQRFKRWLVDFKFDAEWE